MPASNSEPKDSNQKLNFLHLEALLEDASKFLDRCRELRAGHDSLHLENGDCNWISIVFFRLDQLQTRELQAGAETLPHERALLESAAAKRLEENHKNSEAQLKALREDLIASGFNQRMLRPCPLESTAPCS